MTKNQRKRFNFLLKNPRCIFCNTKLTFINLRIVGYKLGESKQRVASCEKCRQEHDNTILKGFSYRRRDKKEVFTKLVARDGQQCKYCGIPLSYDEATIDHVKPISVELNGNRIDNLALACEKCNHDKKDNIIHGKTTPGLV